MSQAHRLTSRILMTLAAALLALPSATLGDYSARPWEHPNGPACFEQWIGVATGKLNDFDWGLEKNGQKPWRINHYGIPVHRFLKSEYAPENWGDFGGNKYAYMWGNYKHGEQRWVGEDWNRCGIPLLKPYIYDCLGISASRGTSPTRGTGQVSPAPTPPNPAPQPVAQTPPSPVTPAGRCDQIQGAWLWFNGVMVECFADRTCTSSNGFGGPWRCLVSSGRFEIQWSRPGQTTPYVDTLDLSPDGWELSGVNQSGQGVGGHRPEYAGGAPRPGCDALLGRWRWSGGHNVECFPDGTCTASNGLRGPWRCINRSGRFEIRWARNRPDEFIDTFLISPLGSYLTGKNQYGVGMGAIRQ